MPEFVQIRELNKQLLLAGEQEIRLHQLIEELANEGRRAASNACRVGQTPSEHYPLFWEYPDES